MDSLVNDIANWAPSTHVGQATLAVAAMVLFAVAWLALRVASSLRAAARIMANQYDLANELELEGLVNWAEARGKKSLVLEQLAKVRRLYGHGSVRKGHIYWLADVVDGKLELIDPPPHFKPKDAQ